MTIMKKKIAKKPRNRAAQNTTLINKRATDRQVARLEARIDRKIAKLQAILNGVAGKVASAGF